MARGERLDVRGAELFHRHGGTGARAFVFVHGFGGDSTTWLFNLPYFETLGRVFAFDLPAHGKSQAEVRGAGAGAMAELLLDYMDALSLERADIVAHSLGGAIAARAAARAPHRVRSLSLIAPAGFGAAINAEFTATFAEMRDRETARRVLSLLVANPRLIGSDMIDGVLAHLEQPGVREGLREIAAANFGPGALAANLESPLRAASIPLRIVWGDSDRILPPPPGVALVSGVGHMPHLEAPTRVNPLLVS